MRSARFCLVLLAVSVAGCAATDPYQRTGAWQPSGTVQGNLAAMVADPHDLVRGHGDATPSRHEADLAIAHLWLDQPRPFIGVTQGPAGGQAPQGPGAPPASPAPAAGGN
jgi:type IV pilus biogenesis protein CpaD/CtpE